MVAIIIPCYNEEKRFKKKEWIKYICSRNDYHFFFVDDGSTDNTLTMLNVISLELSNVTILKSKRNIGKGPIIRFAVMAIDIKLYDYVSFIDADLEIPLSQIDALYKKLLANPKSQMCLTYRSFNNENKKYIRTIGSKIVRKLSSKIIKISDSIEDTQCGCKMFSKEVIHIFDEPFISKWLFDIELILRVRSLLTHDNEFYSYVRLQNLQTVDGKNNYSVKDVHILFNDFYLINKCYN
jgi:dolichyl-phosphate beta-glucosyltransferase